MLRISLMSFLSMIFFVSSSHSAIIVAGDLTEAEQEKIESALRTYTGPSPKYFEQGFQGPKNPDVHNILLKKETPFAEVEFLKNYFQKENITARVEYIPTTIWDLHVISKYLTNPEIKQSYQEMVKSGKDKAFRTRYFDLSKELMSTLDSEPNRNTQYFISLANTYLRSIDQNKIVQDALSEALAKELQKIDSGSSSILHKMISEEMEAGEKNKVLLVRATNGLPLKSRAQTREEFKVLVKKQIAPKGSSEETLERLTDEHYTGAQWYEDLNPQGKILDFPLLGFSAWESINKFQEQIEERDYFETMNISYADSLLAGYLFDSFARYKGACSFEYVSKTPGMTVYTLHLDKEWLFSKGNQLFHLPFLETDGIFGLHESFHPRLRSVAPSSMLREHLKKDVTYSLIATDCIEIDSSFPSQDLSETTNARKDNIKMLQYVLRANEILTQARVVSFNSQILDIQNYPQEVKAILQNQKKLSSLLQEKVGKKL